MQVNSISNSQNFGARIKIDRGKLGNIGQNLASSTELPSQVSSFWTVASAIFSIDCVEKFVAKNKFFSDKFKKDISELIKRIDQM